MHLAAVLFHLLYKRDNLIRPMFTGRRAWEDSVADAPRTAPLWLAALIALLAAGAVIWLVR